MAPFGPYSDFDDCVSKNSDKGDPKAYCATIQRNIEGGDKGGKHVERHVEWVTPLMFAEGNIVKRTIDVFRVGSHTDSAGITREWGAGDLSNMVKAFEAGVPGRVPLKIGHTSDAFNAQLAEKLGIPTEILTGESGEGAASLGHITKLYVEDNILKADVELSPPLAKLTDDKLFRDVSSEIFDHRTDGKGVEYGPVLSAVALLGAERPAVKDLVAFSTKIDQKMPDRVLAFTAFEQEKPKGEHKFVHPVFVSQYVAWLRTTGDPVSEETFMQWYEENDLSRGGEELSEAEITSALLEATRQMGIPLFSEAATDRLNRSSHRDHREAVNKAMGFPLPDETFAAMEHVMEGSMKDALLSGTVQRTGVGNTARSVWDLLRGGFFKGFKEGEDGVDDDDDDSGESLYIDDEDECELYEEFADGKRRRIPWNTLATIAYPVHAIQQEVRGKGTRTSAIMAPGVAGISRIRYLIKKRKKRKAGSSRNSEPVVSALIFTGTKDQPVTVDVAKAWMKDHRYVDADWTVTQKEDRVTVKPAAYKFNPSLPLTYKYVALGDNIKAVVGMPDVGDFGGSTHHISNGKGDLDMVQEATLRRTLGIGPKEDIMATVTKLVETSKFSESMASTVKSLDHDRRIMRYEESTKALTTVTGTPRELAEKLAVIEEKHGEGEAKSMLASWQAVQSAAERAGVLSTFTVTDAKGTVTKHPIEVQIEEMAKADKITIPEATAKFAQAKPKEWGTYWQETRVTAA